MARICESKDIGDRDIPKPESLAHLIHSQKEPLHPVYLSSLSK